MCLLGWWVLVFAVSTLGVKKLSATERSEADLQQQVRRLQRELEISKQQPAQRTFTQTRKRKSSPIVCSEFQANALAQLKRFTARYIAPTNQSLDLSDRPPDRPVAALLKRFQTSLTHLAHSEQKWQAFLMNILDDEFLQRVPEEQTQERMLHVAEAILQIGVPPTELIRAAKVAMVRTAQSLLQQCREQQNADKDNSTDRTSEADRYSGWRFLPPPHGLRNLVTLLRAMWPSVVSDGEPGNCSQNFSETVAFTSSARDRAHNAPLAFVSVMFRFLSSLLHRLLLSNVAVGHQKGSMKLNACLACLCCVMEVCGQPASAAAVVVTNLMHHARVPADGAGGKSAAGDTSLQNSQTDQRTEVFRCIAYVWRYAPKALNLLKRERHFEEDAMAFSPGSNPSSKYGTGSRFESVILKVLLLVLQQASAVDRSNVLEGLLHQHGLSTKNVVSSSTGADIAISHKVSSVLRAAIVRLENDPMSNDRKSPPGELRQEVCHAIELLVAVFGWPWMFEHVVRGVLWPALQRSCSKFNHIAPIHPDSTAAQEKHLRNLLLVLEIALRMSHFRRHSGGLKPPTVAFVHIRLYLHTFVKTAVARKQQQRRSPQQPVPSDGVVHALVYFLVQLYCWQPAGGPASSKVPKDVQKWTERRGYVDFVAQRIVTDCSDV